MSRYIICQTKNLEKTEEYIHEILLAEKGFWEALFIKFLSHFTFTFTIIFLVSILMSFLAILATYEQVWSDYFLSQNSDIKRLFLFSLVTFLMLLIPSLMPYKNSDIASMAKAWFNQDLRLANRILKKLKHINSTIIFLHFSDDDNQLIESLNSDKLFQNKVNLHLISSKTDQVKTRKLLNVKPDSLFFSNDDSKKVFFKLIHLCNIELLGLAEREFFGYQDNHQTGSKLVTNIYLTLPAKKELQVLAYEAFNHSTNDIYCKIGLKLFIHLFYSENSSINVINLFYMKDYRSLSALLKKESLEWLTEYQTNPSTNSHIYNLLTYLKKGVESNNDSVEYFILGLKTIQEAELNWIFYFILKNDELKVSFFKYFDLFNNFGERHASFRAYESLFELFFVTGNYNFAKQLLNFDMKAYDFTQPYKSYSLRVDERTRCFNSISGLTSIFKPAYESLIRGNKFELVRLELFDILGWISTRSIGKVAPLLNYTEEILTLHKRKLCISDIEKINHNSIWHYHNNYANFYEKQFEETGQNEFFVSSMKHYIYASSIVEADKKWISGSYANIAYLICLLKNINSDLFEEGLIINPYDNFKADFHTAFECLKKSIKLKEEIFDLDELPVVYSMVKHVLSLQKGMHDLSQFQKEFLISTRDNIILIKRFYEENQRLKRDLEETLLFFDDYLKDVAVSDNKESM